MRPPSGEVCSVFAGWSAHEWVEGEDAAVREQPDVVRVASEAFHAAVRALERPAFLDDRDDPWTFGDRVAWHRDIGGNVLQLPGQPPAVIDWADVPEWDQLLLRAVLYRIATRSRSEARGENATSSEQCVEQRRPSLEAVLDRVRA